MLIPILTLVIPPNQLKSKYSFRNATSINHIPDAIRKRKANGLLRFLNFDCKPNLILDIL